RHPGGAAFWPHVKNIGGVAALAGAAALARAILHAPEPLIAIAAGAAQDVAFDFAHHRRFVIGAARGGQVRQRHDDLSAFDGAPRRATHAQNDDLWRLPTAAHSNTCLPAVEFDPAAAADHGRVFA